jgi:glucose/arabinose dehydrogenase
MRRTLALSLMLAACVSAADQTSPVDPTVSTPASDTSAAPATTLATVPATTGEGLTDTTAAASPLSGLAYEEVATGLAEPVLVTSRPGDERSFVVTKDGRIWIMGTDGVQATPFLDISDLVRNSGEQGLLGMAFHPGGNGRFFVHYSDTKGDTVLAEYRVSDDPDQADPDAVGIVLTASQPARNHKGGMVQFGPDGMLYLALGDGGGGGDTFGNGQNPDSLLAKLLRLDVAGQGGYTVPPDNPFADGGGAPETWAMGLRNPWRFWFDDGLIYIGDVGQNAFEEIDVAPASTPGLNYGWPITEGLHCFDPPVDCDAEGLTMPMIEVAHGDAGTCSITGGVVYRGSAIPELDGHYLYSDYCGGWLRSFRIADGVATDHRDWTESAGAVGPVLGMGVGGDGEAYLTTSSAVLRIVPTR